MRVSVIVPCHNAAPYIEAALDSVAAQQLQPLEIIVIDDSSRDDSRARVGAWSAAHPDLETVLLRVEARNAAAARNAGIAVARGDWLAFLDADDLWYPHHLHQAAALLEPAQTQSDHSPNQNGQSGDVTFGDVAFMANHHWMSGAGELSPIAASMSHRLSDSSGALAANYWLELIERGFHFGHSTVLMRRERAHEVGAFDESQTRRHDLEFWLRVTQNRTWAYCAREAAAYRTDTPGSISKNLVESELFNLTALLKNRAGYPTQTMKNLIATSARRVMSLAFVDGTRAQQRAARRIAWPYLSPRLRAFYRVTHALRAAGPLVRGALRLKRRWIWRHENSD